MIVHLPQLQAIGCNICEETVELRRSVAEAPELLAMMKEQMAAEHKPCEQYPDNPGRARAERKYCAGMREAFRKPAEREVIRPVFARCRSRF